MYKSPIQTYTYNYIESIKSEFDEQRMKAVVKLGFDVDKNELIKALKYDRNQYLKGYQDCMDDQVKVLEKALDIAIKELCIDAKGADACNYLDVLYEGVRERIMEQARKEVKE